MFTVRDTKQLLCWQKKRAESPYWYNVNDPVISVELEEIATPWFTETQMKMSIVSCGETENPEIILMTLSDALLQEIQAWFTRRKVPLHLKCSVLLLAESRKKPQETKCVAMLINIPVFWFFPWSISLTRKMLARMDAMSYYLFQARCQAPKMQIPKMKLIISVY